MGPALVGGWAAVRLSNLPQAKPRTRRRSGTKASGASTERPSRGFPVLFSYHFYLRTWPRNFNELAGKRLYNSHDLT